MTYKEKDRQREYQRNGVRQKRAKGSTRTKMVARVRSSDGTEQDSLRAGNDRLIAVLGGPVIVPVEPEQQSHSPMMVGYVPPK